MKGVDDLNRRRSHIVGLATRDEVNQVDHIVALPIAW